FFVFFFFTLYYIFFFSSRRRHTRSYGDWSSDVCSSDLGVPTSRTLPVFCNVLKPCFSTLIVYLPTGNDENAKRPESVVVCVLDRSEERRVGKECRSRESQ